MRLIISLGAAVAMLAACSHGTEEHDEVVISASTFLLSPDDIGACLEPKVAICHVPPGNPANAHVLCVSSNAWAAHEANHGDTLATAESCDDGVDNDCDGLTDCDDADCEESEACDDGGPVIVR